MENNSIKVVVVDVTSKCVVTGYVSHATNLHSFQGRISVGKAGESAWEQFCNDNGLEFEPVGYEHTNTPEEIAELKKRSDWAAKKIRHYPDVLVEGSKLVQVKTAPSQPTPKYKAVTVEADSFAVSCSLSASGSPVLLVYVYGDGSIWGNWISEIRAKEPYSQGHKTGSGTPFLLIDKKFLKPIENFVEDLVGVQNG